MAAKTKRSGIVQLLISVPLAIILTAGVFAFFKTNHIRNAGDFIAVMRDHGQRTKGCMRGETCHIDTDLEGLLARPEDGLPDVSGIFGRPDSNDSGSIINGESSVEPVTSYSPEQILDELNTIIPTVDEQDVEYNRKGWKHWTGSPCNTREVVIQNQGEGVETQGCKATSGSWFDPYTGKTFSHAKGMDLDHVIPLGYANSHGGATWSDELKENFANDQSHLILVDASANRQKGDKGPGEWMPPRQEFHCEYSRIWVNTSVKYGLGLEEADKVALSHGLSTCGG